MSFLLQCFVALKLWPELQPPFHLEGIGPRPSSLKTADSGHIPACNSNGGNSVIFFLLIRGG